MSKIGINIDSNYRRVSAHAAELRRTVRDAVHPPRKRVTTGMLFAIGVAALILAGSSLYAMH